MRMLKLALTAGTAAAVAAAGTVAHRRPFGATSAPATGDSVPRYAGDSLIRPAGFERWVFAGASMGLGYSQPSGADAAAATGGVFHNVYIEPTAYDYYVRTGKFREKTMMAMTLYEPGQKVHPSKQGFFEGDFIAIEFSVKDSGDIRAAGRTSTSARAPPDPGRSPIRGRAASRATPRTRPTTTSSSSSTRRCAR